MDLRYIKLITESYYNDNKKVQEIYKSKDSFLNDIYEEIQTILTNFRLESPTEYFNLYTNYDKGQQQKILYNLIEMSLNDRFPEAFPLYTELTEQHYNEIILNEGVMTVPFTILGAAVAIVAGVTSTHVGKIIWSLMTKFNNLNNRIHDFIKRFTAIDRVKLAIIKNNCEDCYKKCGIENEKDISLYIGNSVQREHHPLSWETQKGREQAYCLTNCYLNWSLDQLDMLVKAYVSCLRNSGQRGNDMNDIQLMMLSAPSDSICKPYYDLLKDHKAQFDDIVDVVCKDTMEKEDFKRRYTEVINNAAANANKINNNSTGRLSKDSFTPKKHVELKDKHSKINNFKKFQQNRHHFNNQNNDRDDQSDGY